MSPAITSSVLVPIRWSLSRVSPGAPDSELYTLRLARKIVIVEKTRSGTHAVGTELSVPLHDFQPDVKVATYHNLNGIW